MRKTIAVSIFITSMMPSISQAKWEYDSRQDKMRGITMKFARTISTNQHKFKFPYHGGSRISLVIAKKNEEDRIYLMISKGQFLCPDVCQINVKFDSEEIQTYDASTSSDGSSNFLYINKSDEIISKLKKTKYLVIESEFFNEGSCQFEFNISTLKWE